MHKQHVSDNELYQQLQGRRRTAARAFSELYDRHAARVYGYSRKILNDEDLARDVLQDCFLKLLTMARKNKAVINIPALLLRMARNNCLNMLKQQRHEVIDDVNTQNQAIRDTPYEETDALRLIEAALETLPEDYREAFLLKEHAGMTYQEVAQASNISMTAARSRIFRARKALKEILAPYIKDYIGE